MLNLSLLKSAIDALPSVKNPFDLLQIQLGQQGQIKRKFLICVTSFLINISIHNVAPANIKM